MESLWIGFLWLLDFVIWTGRRWGRFEILLCLTSKVNLFPGCLGRFHPSLNLGIYGNIWCCWTVQSTCDSRRTASWLWIENTSGVVHRLWYRTVNHSTLEKEARPTEVLSENGTSNELTTGSVLMTIPLSVVGNGFFSFNFALLLVGTLFLFDFPSFPFMIIFRIGTSTAAVVLIFWCAASLGGSSKSSSLGAAGTGESRVLLPYLFARLATEGDGEILSNRGMFCRFRFVGRSSTSCLSRGSTLSWIFLFLRWRLLRKESERIISSGKTPTIRVRSCQYLAPRCSNSPQLLLTLDQCSLRYFACCMWPWRKLMCRTVSNGFDRLDIAYQG